MASQYQKNKKRQKQKKKFPLLHKEGKEDQWKKSNDIKHQINLKERDIYFKRENIRKGVFSFTRIGVFANLWLCYL